MGDKAREIAWAEKSRHGRKISTPFLESTSKFFFGGGGGGGEGYGNFLSLIVIFR